ncbi:ead/Ea22-like family protein [Salmonella enterica subsp. enterica serovar Saintpaul]|nr:ead/Ea22-like family protein [Salmonella enterica subsp. enterica serovar Saintpaul]EIR2569796.1 ead/Ea22-like family protein [Salmonella enterica subsp. enterica serovar Saintpaul]EIT4565449.1 ead/Ea22-like family protein [Salmonella enterica subsp. enterica serovar Saintpaul]EIV1950144.1 ead/Ea22-like family protein [Salmonella enterica subsp. enterica serovar Saintpaul]
MWDKEQLRQVYSEKSFDLECKVRELEARNQKDFVWRGKEISRLNDEVDELKEKLEAAEMQIVNLKQNCENDPRIHEIVDLKESVAELATENARIAEQREYYEGVIADGSKRIAELEKGHQEAAKQINSWRRLAKQNIAERGKDISELEAARQRIAELEARAVNLPKRSVDDVMHLSGFSRDYAEGWCAGNDNAMHEIRAAGIKVKGE